MAIIDRKFDNELYVYPGVSYEAQLEHGQKRFRAGESVAIHRHKVGEHCTTGSQVISPDGPSTPPDGLVTGCARWVLTGQDGGSKLVDIAEIE